ncbi:MAG: flavodoxin family protein [Oscillospiraceae bacterium]|nr:flavodoxin family protein [Oscillospiraceae bacterium]
MNVLILNGSPRSGGNTARLLKEATDVFDREGVTYDLYSIGSRGVRGCMACGYCHTHGACVLKDDVNALADKLAACDGLLVASPVYYGSANGSLVALLDRLFYSSPCDKRMKVGAAFAVARRAGTTAAFDELNKYFTISQMPIASGRYWNNGFGREKGEISADEEGLQNARVVARNMVFLMRSIALGRERYGLPEQEETAFTHFVR